MNTELSPYAEVELQPLLHSNGAESSRVAVVVDPQGDCFEAGVMSRDYKLISNKAISNVAYELLDRTDLPYEEHKVLWDGRRFKQQFVIAGMEAEVEVGDVVAVMLCAQNSYQGSLMAGLSLELLRLSCSNGLCVSHVLGKIALKHWGERDFENELRMASQQILNVGEKVEKVLPRLKAMTQKQICRADIQDCYRQTGLPMSTRAKAFDLLEEDSEWMLYQSITDVLTRQDSFSSENFNKKVSQYFISDN